MTEKIRHEMVFLYDSGEIVCVDGYHYYKCTDTACGRMTKEACTYSSSCDELCNVCQSSDSRREATHQYAYVSNDGYHWLQCIYCEETSGTATAHTWELSEDTDFVHKLYCEICGKQNQAAHEYVTDNNDYYHWQECECGYKCNSETHTYVITTTATEKHYSCTGCSRNYSIPLGDDPSNDDPSNDDPSNDDPSNDDPSNDDPSNDNPSNDNPPNDNPSNNNPSDDTPPESNLPTDESSDSTVAELLSAFKDVGKIAVVAVILLVVTVVVVVVVTLEKPNKKR